MKIHPIVALIITLVFSLFAIVEAGAIGSRPQDPISPTPSPTYDPLAEPVLRENPTELELGEFWYWHNCMTCHGDLGQGLTDEFRAIWPEDHQNCWGRGCHSGNQDSEGFPIPRYVPPLVTNDKLSQFSTQQSLVAYLKATHPPQDPGVLEEDQYLAIARFLFDLNNRPFEEPTQVPTTPPTTAVTPIPTESPEADTTWFPLGILSIGIILVIVIIWRLSIKSRKERIDFDPD